MKRVSAVGFVVLVGVLVLAGPAMADTHDTNASNQTGGQPSFGQTQFVVTIYDNGSARWTQRYNQPLANRTQVQRFHAYADGFNSEETPLYTDFKQRATGLTADGANATGRGMAAQGFTRSARVVSQPTQTGTVEMSFLWTNFTATENGQPVVGDAFENGLYLSSDMSIEFEAGPGLSVDWASVEPKPDASTNATGNTTDSVTYFGQSQFASGQPHVAFASNSSLMASTSSTFDEPLVLAAGAFIALALLGVVVVWRSETPLLDRSDRPDAATETDDVETAASATTDASEADATTAIGPTPAITDADLRSDEDRIIELLEANGGRMQQGAIVIQTEWSKSKVSTLLSEMEDAGAITKLRVGRENIVSLAGHEPEAARSPFDDG